MISNPFRLSPCLSVSGSPRRRLVSASAKEREPSSTAITSGLATRTGRPGPRIRRTSRSDAQASATGFGAGDRRSVKNWAPARTRGTPSAGPRRWRVTSTKPAAVIPSTSTAPSELAGRALRNASTTRRRLGLLRIEMKSITIRPARLRMTICRAISGMAARLACVHSSS